MNDVFRALSDPTRREILELLRSGPRSSGEIADKFSTSWATISRHLSVLKDADLILAERNGQHIVYELNTTVFHDVVEHLIKWLRPEKGRSNA
jgi:ArsR family transcriptional regulator